MEDKKSKKDLSGMNLEELWELFPIILKKHNPEYKYWYLEEKEKLIKVIHLKVLRKKSFIYM